MGILQNDDEIRNARVKARAQHGDMLVPIGDRPTEPQTKQNIQFGMGAGSVSQGVSGATFSLSNVPNLYEGRPERYFDSENDPRRRPGGDAIPDFSTWNVTDMVGIGGGNDQTVEEKKTTTSDLLDLVFNSSESSANPNLPSAGYLPALQKQKELEQQLAQQQEQLKALQQQQQQQQILNNNVNIGMGNLGMPSQGVSIGLPTQNMGFGTGIAPQHMSMGMSSQNIGTGTGMSSQNMGLEVGMAPQNMGIGMPSQSVMSPSLLQQQQQPVTSMMS